MGIALIVPSKASSEVCSSVLDAALVHHVGVMICIGSIVRHRALPERCAVLCSPKLDTLCCYLFDGLIDTLSMIVLSRAAQPLCHRNEAPLTAVFVSKV
jgi:hypothetical protein